MKWVTRERARVDRIACPWLITRFIDPKPEFLFVPAKDVIAVASREQAIQYDVPNVELGHRGPRCSFDAFVDRYELDDPALLARRAGLGAQGCAANPVVGGLSRGSRHHQAAGAGRAARSRPHLRPARQARFGKRRPEQPQPGVAAVRRCRRA